MADREFINRRNQHGFSALHEAAINGRARAVEVRPRVPGCARRQTRFDQPIARARAAW